MSYEFNFHQQGWQCPVCGAVYSPTTMQCFNCTGWKLTNTSTKAEKADMNLFRERLNNSAIRPIEEQEGR